MGESLAHLNYLVTTGAMRRYLDNGITRFVRTDMNESTAASQG